MSVKRATPTPDEVPGSIEVHVAETQATPEEIAAAIASAQTPAPVEVEILGLTGPDTALVDPPEEHTNFAPEAPSTIGAGWPIGVYMGAVSTTWLGDLEYSVDPDTGCITGPV